MKITGAGAGPGSEFFLLPRPGRDYNFVYCRGWDLFFSFPGPRLGRDKNFEMIGAGAEPGLEKIGNAEAGPGLEVI